MSTTPEFEAISQRNTIIRSKSEMPYTAGRHSSAQICHKIAKEKNLLSDCEVGRTETFIQTHTSKNQKKQYPEKLNKMRSIMIAEPETRLTSANDALVKVLGKKIQEGAHVLWLQRDYAKKDLEVENVKARLDTLTNTVSKLIDSQGGNNVNFVSPHASSSSTPSSLSQHQDKCDMGKKCEVYGWGGILVAYGEVVGVDPQMIVHNVKMGDGNYKLLIESAEVPNAILFRQNSQVAVIDDVVNSYTVWPKAFLKFVG